MNNYCEGLVYNSKQTEVHKTDKSVHMHIFGKDC